MVPAWSEGPVFLLAADCQAPQLYTSQSPLPHHHCSTDGNPGSPSSSEHIPNPGQAFYLALCFRSMFKGHVSVSPPSL